MDSQSNRVAAQKYVEKPQQAEDKVKEFDYSIYGTGVEYSNIKYKWRTLGKAFVVQKNGNG